jgi:Putative beta-barrel porin-2, OmpL-like. bbp2
MALGLALASFPTFAKKDKTTDSTSTGKMVMSGYMDTYYNIALNDPKSGNTMGYDYNNNVEVGAGRAFDRLDKQFSLGLVQTKFAYTNSKSEAVVDLTFGPNAQLGNFGNTLSGVSSSYLPSKNAKNTLYGSAISIKQAYFTYKATSKLSFTAGQFGTHIGYEVIDAPVNYHYSLSNLFNNGPFYHIGAKATYAFTDKVSLMVGAVNNWDALTDWKKQKSFIAQLYFSPVKNWNVYLNYIGGKNDDPYKIPTTTIDPSTAYLVNYNYTRNLFDLTTGYQVTDKFYLGLNAAYGFYSYKDFDGNKIKGSKDAGFVKDSSSRKQWGGVAGYANYKFSDMFGIGVRYEWFDDKAQVRYLNGSNNSLTVTAPITVAEGHLTLRPEVRWDKGYFGNSSSKLGLYEDKNGNRNADQVTIGLSAVYKF